MGLIYAQQGRYDEAIALYRSAIAIDPTASKYVNLGNALEAQGDEEAAIAAFESALKLDPRFAMAFNNLVRLYDRLDLHTTAILHGSADLTSEWPVNCSLGTLGLSRRHED